MKSQQKEFRVVKRVKQNVDGCILLDVDAPRKPTPLPELLRLLRIMEIEPLLIRYDRTLHGWHIVIFPLTPLTPAIILIAQATLGDDPRRSAYNLKRLKKGIWLNQLFEPER